MSNRKPQKEEDWRQGMWVPDGQVGKTVRINLPKKGRKSQ